MPEHQPFICEQQMIRYFANNLSTLEPYLIKCVNARTDTSEYSVPTDHGGSRARIDILAADCNGGLVIIECKLMTATHHVIGQIAAYATALRRHMADTPNLRLRVFVVCKKALPLLWYAASGLTGIKVEVFTYDDDKRVRRLNSPLDPLPRRVRDTPKPTRANPRPQTLDPRP